VPLFQGPLQRTDRPWDVILPDGKRVYKPLLPKKHHRRSARYYRDLNDQYVVPPYPLPEQSFPDEPCDGPPAPPTSRRHANPFAADGVLPMPDLVDEYHSGHGEVISDEQ
jgi:hypothetical protein